MLRSRLKLKMDQQRNFAPIASQELPSNVKSQPGNDDCEEVIYGASFDGVPEISVAMIAYNHGSLIGEAIRGVLSQGIDVAIELIIADDASTDHTRNVVRQMCSDSRMVVRYIRGSVNRGMLVNFRRALSACRGRYVALIEADDGWLSPEKLQRQFRAMELHPELDVCFHPTNVVLVETGEEYTEAQHSGALKKILLRDVILGDGGFMPTASIFFRRSGLKSLPAWIFHSEIIDYYLQIYLSRRGGALFLPEVMSVYRSGVPGSWTSQMRCKYAQSKQFYSIALHLRLIEGDVPRAERRHVRAMRLKYLRRVAELNGESSLAESALKAEMQQLRPSQLESTMLQLRSLKARLRGAAARLLS